MLRRCRGQGPEGLFAYLKSLKPIANQSASASSAKVTDATNIWLISDRLRGNCPGVVGIRTFCRKVGLPAPAEAAARKST